MGAVSIGPLVLAADRFAAVSGILVFLVITGILAARVDRRFGTWSSAALALGLVSARLGHVVENAASFAQEPLRVFAVWQGGFSWIWAILPVALITVAMLPGPKARLWSALSVGVGILTWLALVEMVGGTSAVVLPRDTYRDLSGAPINLSAAAPGRPLVVNLWASWCPPCRREMPLLAEVAAQEKGVAFYFANQGESEQVIAAYLQEEEIALANVIVDPSFAISKHYGAMGLPATLFIGSDGQLRDMHFGEISREALASNVARLRAEIESVDAPDEVGRGSSVQTSNIIEQSEKEVR